MNGILYHPPPGASEADSDRAFYEHIRSALKSTERDTGQAKGVGIYILSIAMLTFGRLDAVPGILDNIPSQNMPTYGLSAVLHDILPVPQNLRDNWKLVAEWFEHHKHELRWSENAGRFELNDHRY